MLASRTASAACGVPGTDASTADRTCSSGIFLNSSGSVGVANVHGPVKSGAENQRPATRKNTGPVLPIRKTSLSVLLTQNSWDPVVTGTYVGSPFSRIISEGCIDTNTFGASLALIFLPGRLSLTSFQLASSGSFLKLSGSVPAGPHGPCRSIALSQT